MTVAELQSRMDSAEITEWRAYFAILNEDRANDGKPKVNSPDSFKGLLSGMSKKKRKT